MDKILNKIDIPPLKLTAFAPENGWLEYDRFLLGPGLFSGAMLVLGSVTCLCLFYAFFEMKNRSS